MSLRIFSNTVLPIGQRAGAAVFAGRTSGSHTATIPSNGSHVLTWKMNSMLVKSAIQPKKAEPMPPNPNISPKKMPAIMPTLSGFKSVA